MKITGSWVDIETLRGMFLYMDKDLYTGEWRSFEISDRKNELYYLVKYLKDKFEGYCIGFNVISFDMQVIQYILDNYDKWVDLSAMEVVHIIYAFSQELISNQNYDIRPPYKEECFDIPVIDLFTILNYGNENMRTSLKWIEFSTDMEVESMSVHHGKEVLTDEEKDGIIYYCQNDINATETLYYYVRGNCENKLYKGKDKIQERIDCIEEFGLPKKAISFSDVKIGEAINLDGYMQHAKIKDIGVLYKKKKERKHKQFTFGECIPKYVKFNSPELNDVYNKVKNVKVNINKEQEFPFTFRGEKYIVAKGGLHSSPKAKILISDEDYKYIEFDCSSQYPASIVKRGLFPAHLGKEWLINYRRLIEKRLDAKEKGKKDPKYKGISETFKISINAAGFGATNSRYSVQYDPFVHFQCTIGNQFEILMLTEWLEDAGIHIISSNTDGNLCKVPTSKLDEFYTICKKWEEVVQNTDIGGLEFTHYDKYIVLNVNSYIAIKTDGEIKEKKDFLCDRELHKNKSRRIVALALKEYFINGTNVEKFIRNHKNIYDFCIGVKASKDYEYQIVDRKTGHLEKYDKLIRYYISTSGEKIYKIKKEGSDAKGAAISEVEADMPYQTTFNKAIIHSNFEDYHVDFDYYIRKTKDIIQKIIRVPETPKNQLTLF